MPNNDIQEIDEKLLEDLKDTTLFNIKSILKSVKILLDQNLEENKEILFEHPYVCAGLFTYAIEEYGKLLILRSYMPVNNKVTIEYRAKFLNHKEKFRIAIENLKSISSESIEISKAMFDPAYFDEEYFDTEKTITEFETRKKIFYSDFKDNCILILPHVDQGTLRNAYESFKSVIDSIETA